MKQYLTNEQTTELISRGYPAREHFFSTSPYGMKSPCFTYSIGDLLEFFPTTLNGGETLTRGFTVRKFRKYWVVGYPPVVEHREKELIDALYSLLKTPLISSIYNGHRK